MGSPAILALSDRNTRVVHGRAPHGLGGNVPGDFSFLDTLVLDLAGDGAVACLPGHKRLKLTAEALALTGPCPEEQVAEDMGKFYAAPPAGATAAISPLARSIMLEEGPDPWLERLSGAGRVDRLLFGDHYSVAILAASNGRDPAVLFAMLAQLAQRIEMLRFVRQRDSARFDEGVRFIAEQRAELHP